MVTPVNQSISERVYIWGSRLSGLLFPPTCLVCTEPAAAGRDLCAACAAGLPWLDSACRRCALPLPAAESAGTLCGACWQARAPLQQVHAALLYAAPVDGLLRRFKFHHDLAAGRLLAQLMGERLAAADPPQALVPVPLHRSRLRQRGYDQALELARPLARHLQLPLLAGLRRVRATAAQSELDAATRRRNLRAAFVAAGPLPPHVALVDDVMTTGATLHAAARALRRAGVTRVDAWVCARVP
ncbi:ComF family protein [Stenotrophomonas sp. NLF4-10]|uniref:ComF family protein n=1 Tax=Stenotrophomonas sp. NLF4-10 TaxID=2918754 RepID=UPI001EFC28F2|nr:ComF family protein [Stenotrophomonas sp. NLF4-10]MCG8275157.1 ComF family protein [Stenotrophomonas sp. NLF4-10]